MKLKKVQTLKKIQFHKTFSNISDEYAPKPAIQFIPEWYRKIESSFPERKQSPDNQPTIKKCIPVLDAITTGYIFVTPCDVYVSIKDGEPNYEPAVPGIISFHPRKQAWNHPSANEFQFPKWINPWAIETPKGWSCYFKPPAHNPNPWFEILEGLVDTDTYSAPVNFPFVLLQTDKDFLIPAGTPMAQIALIKRENWESVVDEDNVQATKISTLLNSQFFDRYKSMFWNKKSYR